MGQPVSGDGDNDTGENAENADPGPQTDQRKRARPRRQGIDDAPEQDRLCEQDDADDDVGSDEAAGEPPLRGEQTQGPAIGRRDAYAGSAAWRV